MSRVFQRSRGLDRRGSRRGCGGDGGGRAWLIGIFEGVGYGRRGSGQRERQASGRTAKCARKRRGLESELGFGGKLGARLAGSGCCWRRR